MSATMPAKRKKLSTRTPEGRFAAKLRRLRENAGLSVYDLSDKLTKAGIEAMPPTLYSWENGNRLPNVAAVFALAKLYGIEPKAIFEP